MRHEDVWRAIEWLAADHGLSVSALARKSGLDPTSFNLSKRHMPDGRPRWPSTESIAKVLAATGSSLDRFSAMITGPRHAQQMPARRTVPLIGLAEAGIAGYFDDGGYPAGSGWEEILLPPSVTPSLAASMAPDRLDPNLYALSIHGDSMEPLYRGGDTIIISPATSVRSGDRVVARTIQGEVMAKVLSRHTRTFIELLSLNPLYEPRRFAVADIAAMHRIIWASQ